MRHEDKKMKEEDEGTGTERRMAKEHKTRDKKRERKKTE